MMRALLLALLAGCSSAAVVPRPRAPAAPVPIRRWSAESTREAFWAQPAILCASEHKLRWVGGWRCEPQQ